MMAVQHLNTGNSRVMHATGKETGAKQGNENRENHEISDLQLQPHRLDQPHREGVLMDPMKPSTIWKQPC